MRDKHFKPSLGYFAWPDGCPCCGEEVDQYEAPDAENNAWWRFECGCEIIHDDKGNVYAEDECPEAMNQHMNGIIIHDHAPEETSR